MNDQINLSNSIDDLYHISRMLDLVQLAAEGMKSSAAPAICEGLAVAESSLDLALGRLEEMQGRAENESPLRALYHQWQRVKDACSTLAPDAGERAKEALFAQVYAIEQQSADFEPQTMQDLAFKIIFADDNGAMAMSDHQQALVARAYAMVGLEHTTR